MKTLTILAATLATPALAHSAAGGTHIPHIAYLVVVIGLGVALAVRNAIKG